MASTKAYTSQIVVITMMALALSADSIAKRAQRDEIIDSLAQLPDKLRQVGWGHAVRAGRGALVGGQEDSRPGSSSTRLTNDHAHIST